MNCFKAEFAADVTSLANAAGGILIIGIVEDALAQASNVADVDISDTEVTRYTSIIAEPIALPLPATIRAIENPQNPGHGFVIIAVSRSPLAPHAVRFNEHWRYARRVGRRKVYVSESEIAMAYRDRFTGLQSRLDAAETHERYTIGHLDMDQVYVVITLVPDLDGRRSHWVRAVAIAPDGTWLATGGSGDGMVRIWDPASGTELATLTGHLSGVSSVAITPNGTWLASAGGDDRTVRLSDRASGTELGVLIGHSRTVSSAAIAPDGTWLVTGGGDGMVRIWDRACGIERATLIGHANEVRAVAIAPDGTWFATAGADATVRICKIRPLRSRVCDLRIPATTLRNELKGSPLATHLQRCPPQKEAQLGSLTAGSFGQTGRRPR